jgi:hypothetical protein
MGILLISVAWGKNRDDVPASYRTSPHAIFFPGDGQVQLFLTEKLSF